MMPIPELVRVSRMLDDAGGCVLARRAAGRWALPDATFLRSSASHVFVARHPDEGADVVLRLRPATPAAVAALERSAAAAELLYAAGAPVVTAVRSAAGLLVETVDDYAVTAVVRAAGGSYDEDEADGTVARHWGAVLADFHARAATVGLATSPDMVDLCARPATDDDVPPDPEVDAVADAVAVALALLPRDASVHGLLHGDPELDNVVFTTSGPVLVDFDDVRLGWYAADLGFALRSWGRPGEGPDLDAAVPAAFVAGYRTRRPLSDEELSWLPLLARTAALESWWELQPVLTEPADPAWPTWATELDARVRQRAADLRRALVG
jgi:Ser/Thr protein kinase RdoA (MazF antagonist)